MTKDKDKDKTKAQLINELEALRIEKDKSQKYLDIAGVMIVVLNTAGKVNLINKKGCEILGYYEKEILGKNWFGNFIPKKVRNKVKTVFNKILAGNIERFKYSENPVLTKNGEERIIAWHNTLVHDKADNIIGTLSSGTDITEHKQAEEVIRIQRDLGIALSSTSNLTDALNKILETAIQIEGVDTGGVYIVDRETGELDLAVHNGLSEKFVKSASHYDADSPSTRLIMAGKPVYSLHSKVVSGIDKDRLDEKLRALAVIPVFYKGVVIAALNLASCSNDEIPVTSRDLIEMIANQIGSVIARVYTDEALRNSEEQYHTLFETSRDALGFASPEGMIIDVNQTWLDLYEYTRDKVIGRDVRIIYVEPDDRKRLKEELKKKGYIKDFEVKMQTKSGGILDCLVTANVRKDINGNIIYYQTSTRDITEHKLLESQFIHAQKMESVGRLAGGIAHDFNNILTAITGNAELALMSLSPDDPLYEYMNEIKKCSDRAAQLTRQLLMFSRRQIAEPRIIYLNNMLFDMDKMLRRLIGEDIEFLTIPGEELWPVYIDPGQMEQVLTNLVVNARDAMPGVGKITIETANVKLDEEYAKRYAGTGSGDYVMMTVSDTGTGMDEDTQSHIFEPFFTTKEVGKGTGLGLATCYGIVKQNKGNIWVYSEPVKGTIIMIYLPKAEGEDTGLSKKEESVDLPEGTETVLVVEDEPGVRKMIVRTLKNKDYTVLEASNGEEALQIVEKSDAEIHLLLTDVIMPQMGGRELYENLKKINPSTKALFVSGYTDNAIVHNGFLEAGIQFLQKPFSPSALLRKTRDVLDE